MAKKDEESPADRVKREMAEKEQREKEAAEAAAKQPTSDTLSDEERAAVEAAESEDAKDKELRELRNQLARKDKELSGAEQHIKELQEDPALLAARQEKFRRAEEFEKQHRRPRSGILQRQPTSEDDESPFTGMAEDSEGRISVKMSKDTFDKIYRLATSLPLSTPPEHIMCGYGGIKITVGMIRDMAGVRMR